MVGVTASVNRLLHHKVQKFSSGTSSLGWSRKRAIKQLWRGVVWLYSVCVYVCVTVVVVGCFILALLGIIVAVICLCRYVLGHLSLSILLSFSSHLPVDSAADCVSKRVERQFSPSIDTLAAFLGDRYHCPVCLSVSLVYCGQTAGWIKMPLATELGLSLGDIVLDGDPAATHRKGHSSPPPLFGPCLLWPNDWMDADAIW